MHRGWFNPPLVKIAKINQDPKRTAGGSRGTSILSGPGAEETHRSSTFTPFSPTFVLFSLHVSIYLLFIPNSAIYLISLILFLCVFPIASEGYVQVDILLVVSFPTHQEIANLPFFALSSI